MNDNKTVNHLSLKRIIGILLLLCASLIIMGCMPNEEDAPEMKQETAAKENIPEVEQDAQVEEDAAEAEPDTSAEDKAAIQAVIEKEFTGPDEKYRYLLDAYFATQTGDMSEEEYNATLELPPYKNFMKYMEDTYAFYFTENAYDTFINTGAFSYSVPDGNYKLNVTDIEIIQSENEDTLYNFTFTVDYEDGNGETGEYAFEGEAIVPEEGKIGKIQFNDKDGLSDKIRN